MLRQIGRVFTQPPEKVDVDERRLRPPSNFLGTPVCQSLRAGKRGASRHASLPGLAGNDTANVSSLPLKLCAVRLLYWRP